MKKNILLVLVMLSFELVAQNPNWRTAVLKEGANAHQLFGKTPTNLSTARKITFQNSKEKKQYERWKYYWKDRARPDGSFVSAYHDYSEWLKDNQFQAKLNSPIRNSTKWTLKGPKKPPTSKITAYPGMGRLNTIAFYKDNTDTLYVGAPGGGIWKSTDGGASWVSKGDSLPNSGVSDIVIDPSNPKVIYLATGDFYGSNNRSLGVLKSTDGGDSWKTTGLTFTLKQRDFVANLLIDPNNTNTVFATTKSNIKRTTDGGVTWKNVHTDKDVVFSTIQYKMGSDSTLYATSDWGSLYKSVDNGTKWKIVSNPSDFRIALAQTPKNPNILLLLDSRGGVKKSIDGGNKWDSLSTIKDYNSQLGYNMVISISPIDEKLVLAGGINGYRSKDGGATWETYLDGYWGEGTPYFYVHSDHHEIAFVPKTNKVFSLNDGGIFKGDASSDTAWKDLSAGLSITQYYNVSGTPKNESKLIAGSQDNDVVVFDGEKITGQNPVSDGVEGLWDYSDSNIAWSCSQNGVLLNRTKDNFKTVERLVLPSKAPFVWKMDIHPTKPNIIYAGLNDDIYQSKDRGDTWKKMNSGVGQIACIASAPSDGNVMYVAGSDEETFSYGIKKTMDGGASWTNVKIPSDSLTVKGIAIHPTKPDEVYICYAGYSTKKGGRVYHSKDSGKNWTDISKNLPNIPTHDIDYETGSSDGELFLATDLGVYHWSASKQLWTKLDNGLPSVIVHDLEIHYGTGKIRAATFGRGIWEATIDVDPLPLGIEELPSSYVNVYPNPTLNKKFTIDLGGDLTGNSSILVYNSIGSVVKNFVTTGKSIAVDLGDFSKGIYFVKVTNKGKSTTRKLIVK